MIFTDYDIERLHEKYDKADQRERIKIGIAKSERRISRPEKKEKIHA